MWRQRKPSGERLALTVQEPRGHALMLAATTRPDYNPTRPSAAMPRTTCWHHWPQTITRASLGQWMLRSMCRAKPCGRYSAVR